MQCHQCGHTKSGKTGFPLGGDYRICGHCAAVYHKKTGLDIGGKPWQRIRVERVTDYGGRTVVRCYQEAKE